MQISVSLGLTGQALGHVNAPTGPELDPPIITFLVVDPQTPTGDLPIWLNVSTHCAVHYVLSTSATQPSVPQITAGQDHTGAQAPSSGSIVTDNAASYNAAQGPGLVSGTYHLHAYPINADGAGNRVYYGPFTFTLPTANSV